MKKILIVVMVLVLMLTFGCSSTKKVNRIASDQVVDLSGRWNDTDSRLVSEEMVKDVVAQRWLSNFLSERGEKPVVDRKSVV